ncbi:MAG: hypothetical protein AMXMBFR84_48370 [Candidatus Hydrogenedentota bacterium]
MSNRAQLTRTKFVGDDGVTGWGWRLGDDYTRSYTDACTEQEVPVEPLELLATATAEATEDERQLLENLLQFERGISLNGSWHEFQKIAPTLKKALYGEEE